MKKSTAIVLLVVLGNLITSLIGVALILLFIPLRHMFLVAFAGVGFLAGHTALSVRMYKRFKQRYGVLAGWYVVYAAVPAAALNILGHIAIYICMSAEYSYRSLIGCIHTLVTAIYSAVYLIVLAGRLAEQEPDRTQ